MSLFGNDQDCVYMSWYITVPSLFVSVVCLLLTIIITVHTNHKFYCDGKNIMSSRSNRQGEKNKTDVCDQSRVKVQTSSNQSRSQKREHTNTDNKIQIICMVTLYLFSIQSICMLIHNFMLHYCPAKRWDSPLWVYSGATFNVLYSLPITTLYYLFVIRLIRSFQDSMFEIPNNMQIILKSIFWFEIIQFFGSIPGVLFISFIWKIADWRLVSAVFGVVFVIAFLIGFILVSMVFAKQMRLCSMVLFKDQKQIQSDLFDVVIKQSLCCAFAMATTISSIIIAVLTLGPYKDAAIHNAVFNFDCFLNSMLLMIQWSFNQPRYNKWCKICHNCLKKRFKNAFTRRVDVVVSVSPTPTE